MLSLPWALVAAVAPAIVHAATLTVICTAARVQEALPASGFIPGITIDASSVETTLVSNASVRSEWYPASTIEYCNVTFAYSHDGLAGDRVHVTYWAPAPGSFLNRYVSTGGGGLAINSQSQSIPTGVIVGAVSGITDGGFGSFNTQWDAVFLEANGTVNWQSVYMFGYQAHHELATIGKEFAKNLYGVADGQNIYSYYQGCSEGGVTADTLRDWMQLGMDRYADSLQTTHPDLGGVRAAGGKILHVHGEQDDSVPAASSVRYYESVRAVMFPGRSLDDFYRPYLVPGGAHCGSNANQPGGGWPQTTLQTVIEWVEKGVAPDTLNNTGAGIGALCRWPRRPLWSNNGSGFACVYDRDSIDSWMYTFDAFKMPIY